MEQGKKSDPANANKKVWQICATFGLSVGITIYIVGVLFGGWLDEKLGCAPICTLICVLIAIGSCFARLIYSLSALDKKSACVDKHDKEN